MTLPSNYPVGPAIDAWIARNLFAWQLNPAAGHGIRWIKPDGEVVYDVPPFSTDRKHADEVITAVKALGYEFAPRTRSAEKVCREAIKTLLEEKPKPKKAAKKAAKKRTKK